jgi:hypothetical protein
MTVLLDVFSCGRQVQSLFAMNMPGDFRRLLPRKRPALPSVVSIVVAVVVSTLLSDL